jgi:riboflavin kinase / FMN adenylyltransferase
MNACAIGKFDALHRGHFALVERAATLGQPLVVTFTGMAEILGWEKRAPLIAPSDRQRVLDEWSQQLQTTVRLVEIPFAAVRNLSPNDFVAYLREYFAATAVVVGEDFRYGRNRSGEVKALQQQMAAYGGTAAIVAPICHAHKPISSSRVRAALEAGELDTVAQLLGRPYRLVGHVIHGDGRGKKIGFPTANLGTGLNQAPAIGVYAAWALLGNARIPAAVNIGHLPTISGERPLTIEAHLIDWRGDCYGQPLGLDIVQRIRGEHRFAALDALIAQIQADVDAVRGLLS